MLSCIISDLDGTILPPNTKTIHADVLSAIDRLAEQNIVFCVATGRSYVQTKRLFASLKHPIFFICCDGALIVHREKTLFSAPIENALPHCTAQSLAYGKYAVYASKQNLPFYRKAYAAYNGHILPLEEAKTIYKIACYKAPLREAEGLSRIYKSGEWQEYVASGINKGVAVARLQSMLHISPTQTCIFGDGQNDIPMTAYGKSCLIGSGFLKRKNCFDTQRTDFLTALHAALKEEL